jgi:hypothetical protein
MSSLFNTMMLFDKVWLSFQSFIRGLFLLVKEYFTSKNRGWRYDLAKNVEQ